MIILLNKMQLALRRYSRIIGIGLTIATTLLFAVATLMNISWDAAQSVITGLILFFLVLGLGGALVYAFVIDNKRAIIVLGAIVLGAFLIENINAFVPYPFFQGLIAYNIFRILEMLCLLGAFVLLALGLLMPKFERFVFFRLLGLALFVAIDFISFFILIILAGVNGQGGLVLVGFRFLLMAADLFFGYVYFFGDPIEAAPKVKEPIAEPKEENVVEVEAEPKEEAKEEPKPEPEAAEEK